MPTFAIGARPPGSRSLAGGPLHDPPTVTVSTLGTVSTGGPDLTISWAFAQLQGDAQQRYRVRLWDDALTTLHYDSGWLSGTDTSLVVDVDAEGVPHETADITTEVLAEGPGLVQEYHRGSDVDAFVMDWGVPHATIDSPDNLEVWTDLDGVDVEWSFTDDDGANIQEAYRVRLTVPGSGLELHDTGWVVSTATTYRIPVALSSGTKYRVYVQLKNNHGIRSD